MTPPTTIIVRVRHNAKADTFEASSMTLQHRYSASSTISAEAAVRRAAGKALACVESLILITPAPNSSFIFYCSIKGSLTAHDLFAAVMSMTKRTPFEIKDIPHLLPPSTVVPALAGPVCTDATTLRDLPA